MDCHYECRFVCLHKMALSIRDDESVAEVDPLAV